MSQSLTLFCLVDGEATSNAFSVKVPLSDTVDDLKVLIGARLPIETLSKDLTLWRVFIPILEDDDDEQPILLDNIITKDKKKLGPATQLSKVFPEELPEETIHIIVQRPPPQVHAPIPSRSLTPVPGYPSDASYPSSPPSDDLHVDIKYIKDRFFAAGSKHAEFLVGYVQGKGSLPITEDGLRGLPMVLRRGAVDSEKAQPSLLFMDLPEPPSSADDSIPERFKSNILLGVLETMKAQDLPVFGVSGCGKTRTMIEMLCLQWGFYFNAADKDFGSDDLLHLAEFIDRNIVVESTNINTRFARNATLLFFLSRLLILGFCLNVPDCRQTFSSARWALLQICPHMFKDVFMHLSINLYDLMKGRALLEFNLVSIVRKEFVLLHDKLATLGYPNFSRDSKLRLVIDEAQILSDKSPTSFTSSATESDLRPMLSPLLNAFRSVGLRDELKIVYAGTGLSIRTLHWALSSGDGVKEYGSTSFPYLEFPGWTSVDSVQSYIDRLKDQLLDEESKRRVDTLIPPEAVEMLYMRMQGRFRPVVTCIEGILETGDWETVINNTETMITSWKDRDRRGNLCGELIRVEDKTAKHPELFTSSSSIMELLGLFLYRYYLLDAPSTMLENDVRLVEAAFGRIKLFRGSVRTVLDEPLALKATENYFRVKDPLFFSAAERAMQHSTNASVLGNMWETMMPSVFIETLKARPLSSWPLLDNMSLPEQLVGDVSIVGHHEGQAKLAISHRSMTTMEFMKAHVKNNSKQDSQDVPPFYFPAPHVSGPDLIFFISINESVYPIFVQLKLRQVVETSDLEKGLATVSSHAVQEKMEKEQKKQQHQAAQLQDFCPTGSYISMMIIYPAEAVSLQIHRPDPKPELEGLQRVTIGIDNRNFPKIFPRRHVEFLDILKGTKRRSEEQESQSSKKMKASDVQSSNE